MLHIQTINQFKQTEENIKNISYQVKDIIIEDGFLKFDINKQKQNEFKIVTPTSVASVKGTVFYLDCQKDRDVFYGFEGIVEILNLESNDISNLTINDFIRIIGKAQNAINLGPIQYLG